MTKWKEERATKTAEQKTLYADYYHLRDEAKNAETIKRSVEKIIDSDRNELSWTKARWSEL
jgi:hypothetical protein